MGMIRIIEKPGSGPFNAVLWIRMDPHSFGCLGYPYWEGGSGSRSTENNQNLQINLLSCL
jgi:hypothetical protein